MGRFFEANKIQYEDDGWFPQEEIWNYIKKELIKLIDDHSIQDEKHITMESLLNCYLKFFELVHIQDGRYDFYIRVFNNSRSFAEYFFHI